MNLFRLSYRPRYYLTRPWRIFQETYYNIRNAWSRATKGYSWYDSADMDNFLLHIIPGMLRDIANGEAYPGFAPFDTYTKWQDYCNSLADIFESLQEENWEVGRNEWEEEFEKAFEVLHPRPDITVTTDMTTEEANEVVKMYFERGKELDEERNKLLKDAFASLAENLNCMWI